jgi:hypothetical protein
MAATTAVFPVLKEAAPLPLKLPEDPVLDDEEELEEPVPVVPVVPEPEEVAVALAPLDEGMLKVVLIEAETPVVGP